jgi:hypothetical protein
MNSIFTQLIHSWAHLLYPPICLNCAATAHPPLWLCPACQNQLTLLDPYDRCRRCFAPDSSPTCPSCHPPFTASAALFPNDGVPAVLMNRLMHHPHTTALQLLASFFHIQWDRLNWPTYDRLIALPGPFWRPAIRLARAVRPHIWPVTQSRPGQRIAIIATRLSDLRPLYRVGRQARSLYALALME